MPNEIDTIIKDQIEGVLVDEGFDSPIPAGTVIPDDGKIVEKEIFFNDRTTRLVDYFYEKLYCKLVGISALGSGTILSVNTAILVPTENVSDWVLKPIVVGMSFLGGGLLGGMAMAMTGMAGGVLISEWKNMAREFNKTINRYIL